MTLAGHQSPFQGHLYPVFGEDTNDRFFPWPLGRAPMTFLDTNKLFPGGTNDLITFGRCKNHLFHGRGCDVGSRCGELRTGIQHATPTTCRHRSHRFVCRRAVLFHYLFCWSFICYSLCWFQQISNDKGTKTESHSHGCNSL